jgi:hypothetical protein
MRLGPVATKTVPVAGSKTGAADTWLVKVLAG